MVLVTQEMEKQRKVQDPIMTVPTVQGIFIRLYCLLNFLMVREFNRKRHMELHVLFKHSTGMRFPVTILI